MWLTSPQMLNESSECWKCAYAHKQNPTQDSEEKFQRLFVIFTVVLRLSTHCYNLRRPRRIVGILRKAHSWFGSKWVQNGNCWVEKISSTLDVVALKCDKACKHGSRVCRKCHRQGLIDTKSKPLLFATQINACNRSKMERKDLVSRQLGINLDIIEQVTGQRTDNFQRCPHWGTLS